MPTINRPLTMNLAGKVIRFNGHNDMYQWGYDLERSYSYKQHRQFLLKKYKRCVYCGSVRKLEIDHVHPASRGGTNDVENLVIACKRCNMKKRDHTLSELNVNFFLRWK